jgi:hypothetical protein
MIYAISCELSGILRPGGIVDISKDEVVTFAKSTAEIALDQLGEWVPASEWFNLDGEETDPRTVLESGNQEEILYIIVQISDEMKHKNVGYIDYWEYQDIFELIKEHGVMSWCSEPLKNKIIKAKKEYHSVIQSISEEWVWEP